MLSKEIENFKKNKEIILKIKVRTGADKTELKTRMDDDCIKINIAAVPEKGKANAELLKFLSKIFNLPANNIQIISGASDKYKLIKIKNK